MKKVLFYYDNYCGEQSKGGTEVATFRIAKALKDSGKVEVYNAYRSNSFQGEETFYRRHIRLSSFKGAFKKDLAKFIIDNEIDVVVNMGKFFRHKSIVEALKNSGRDVKVIFMQHFAPGSEIKKSSYVSGRHLLKLNPLNPIYWLRASVYPLIKMPRKLKFKDAYSFVYNSSHNVILLSEGYKEDYNRISGGSDTEKMRAIPNIFELPVTDNKKEPGGREDNLDVLPYKAKKKRVLFMSRLDEIQKRISLALKIWRKIEDDPDLCEWHLDIVGTGHNADIAKRLIKKLRLQNVTLHGWQPREKFLEEDAILMMTSEYEGLPLSILEARSYGCVPIAFNSFASLKDVVENFETGVIIDNFGDIDVYAKKLTELMYDETYRSYISRKTREGLEKFSSQKIAEEWLKILT